MPTPNTSPIFSIAGDAQWSGLVVSANTTTDLTFNFTTPHQPIYTNKIIDKVELPGEGGEYGVTAQHSPIISQLAPGLVTVHHINGENEIFFIPGGFAITHANSVTVSQFE